MTLDASTPFTAKDIEQFFSMSPDLLAIATVDGHFKQVSSGFIDFTGQSPSELLNSPVVSFFHGEDQPAIKAALAQLTQGDRTVQFQGRWQCPEGTVKRLDWRIQVCQDVPTDEGQLYCLIREVSEQPPAPSLGEGAAPEVTQSSTAAQPPQETQREKQSQRFQSAFNQTFQLIWLLDADGIVQDANRAVFSFLSVTREQVLNLPLWELPGCSLANDTLQQLKRAIAQSSRGHFTRYELELLGGNHVVSTLDFSIKPLRDDAGNVTCLIAEGRDITERKTTEAALHQLNLELERRVARRTTEIHQYAEAIENMQDGFHLWKLEDPSDARSFRLVLANPAAEQLLQIANDQILGKTMPEVLPSWFQTNVPESCRQVVQHGQNLDLDTVEHELPWGDRRIFALKLFNLDSECLGILFEDVTRQHRVQQELTEQREQLRILFEQAGVGIARIALDGRWIQVNEKLSEILGYTRDELFQTDVQTLTYLKDAEAEQKYYQPLFAGNIDSASFEQRYVRKSGEPIWCSVTASVIRDNHHPKYLIAFIEDITERKAAALTLQHQKNELTKINKKLAHVTKKLQTQNQELDQFAYVASHDLKAPLRAIANLATWIEEDISDILPPENREQLELLRGRVQRMENLINGLLSYSRAGRTEQVYETIDVGQLVQDIIEMLAPPEAFTITVAPDLPTFSINRVPFTQVLTNLINNAIKHHDQDHGTIHIGGQPTAQPEFFEFSVTDDGPGIGAEYHDKIFDIFQVLEARDKVENTGIGLAIVKKMVEAEGGNITVDSQVGKGTTFRFTWPCDN
jgi:PAS domain S-box-containing protein